MSSPPKSSLIERLVQDRLRAGELDSSATQLLNLGENQPGETKPGGAPGSMPGGAMPGPGAMQVRPLPDANLPRPVLK